MRRGDLYIADLELVLAARRCRRQLLVDRLGVEAAAMREEAIAADWRQTSELLDRDPGQRGERLARRGVADDMVVDVARSGATAQDHRSTGLGEGLDARRPRIGP